MTKHIDLLMEQKKLPNEIDPVLFQINDLYGTGVFPAHFHEEIEILHVIYGKISVSIFGNDYVISKGELCFVPSMAIHTICNLGEPSKYDCCLLNVSYFAKENIDIKQYSISPVISDSAIVDEYKKLRNTFHGNQQLFKNTMIRSLGICFLINLIDRCSEKNSIPNFSNDKKAEIVKQVSLYLKNHSSENIDIDTISKDYGYSSSYLSRLFKKYTHTTMSKTLNNYRCLNAQKLLMTENLSVTEICEMCGYSNFSYFTKTYKECIGELPSATKNKYSR